jgi:predicted aspartyl protease
MRQAAALLLLLLTTGALAQAPAALPDEHAGGTETIQGRQDRERRLTVPVRIGGSGPFHFVVDTGSQRSLVASSVAARLALPASATLFIVDVGGRQEVATAVADELGIGRRTYRDLVMPVLEDEHLAADGVIGTDNMQGQRVLFDFTRNRLQIGRARDLGGNRGYEIVVTARRKSGQLIITEAEVDRVRVSVVIDTGAETSIGNRALQRALARRGAMTQVTLISVTGTEVVADYAPFDRLSIGRVSITNPAIAFADSPVFAALDLDRKPAMMLGMRELRLFKRVALDFASRRVMFDLPPGV